MIFYFTGSDALDGIQTSPMKSLGGYRSSTPVPNGSMNKLFDDISNQTIKDSIQVIRGIVLKNTLGATLNTVKLNVVYDRLWNEYNNEVKYEFAIVALNSSGQMEKLADQYSIPYYANFVSCEACKSDGILKVTSGGEIGDTVTILGVVTAALTSTTIENVVDSIVTAFVGNTDYSAIKKSSTEVYFQRKIVGNNDGTFNMTTSGTLASANPLILANGIDNSVVISASMIADASLGIWIKRVVNDNNPNRTYNRDCEKLKEDYDNSVVPSIIERTAINLNWL